MPRRGNQQRLMKMMFMTLGVLIVMLIVVLIIIVTGGGTPPVIVLDKNATFAQGVKIAGVDVSGMTLQQAVANEEIFTKGQDDYNSFSYTFTVQGREFTYNAQELGLDKSIDGALEEALKWGNVGDGATKAAQRQQAQESGVNFPAIHADPETVKGILQSHKMEYDMPPQNATMKVKETFVPGDNAEFVPEVVGADVDIADLAEFICGNINKGDFSVVEAPAIPIEPKITLSELKASTVMTRSWSSSYAKHHDPDRVTNIKIISGLLNGSVIAPMQTWSVNTTAGDRNAQTAAVLGWTEADGIENGRYSEQYGGGVCQVSSTIFNCAIRSELEIIERWPHSWPSDYITAGLDATITTGLKDLKLLNPFDTPVMIVCHVDETAQTVTVEVYGPSIKSGYSIEFDTKTVQTVKPAAPIWHYNVAATPDGKPIAPGKKVTWIEERTGKTIKVYKFYVDAQGIEVAGSRELFTTSSYKAYQAEYYCNYDDPQFATPTPDVS